MSDAPVIDAHWWNAQTLFPDAAGVEWHRSRHLAADIDHMAKDRGEADQYLLVEDRHHHAPVVVVRNRAFACVGIVPDENVAFVYIPFELLDDGWNIGAELPDDHLAAFVAYHREFVVLLANNRRQRDADDDPVHLEACVLQGILDDVERDRINLVGI